MKKFFIFLILVFILVSFLWQGIYLPKNLLLTEDKLFSVEKGQNLFQIAQNLERERLIKNRFFFDFYVIFRGAERKLQSGTYLLSPSISTFQIAKKIISGETYKVKATIPEGFNLKQIEAELSQSLKRLIFCHFSVKDFKDEFEFLEDISSELTLEGFLFPDTYYFSFDISDKEIFRKFLTNFDKKLTLELKEEIKRQNKKIFEIVTMASLIEKEVKTNEDKKIVSGILWKRLNNGIPLQVDATISYITGKKTTSVSIEDTKIDSPYNTYKYQGLPFGPICNPGIESILAAIYPQSSDYWYYLSTPDGKTIFSRTLEEHNLAKAKYLKFMQ